MDIQQKLSQIPKSPGVYFFRDGKGEIIYIGKAKVLKNRVRSYFNSPKGKDPKTLVMVKNIADLEWLVMRSEVEALLTEANLIKEHKPRYNVFLKDDKTFPYIRITNEPYPRVEIIRQKNLTKDDNNYFRELLKKQVKYNNNIVIITVHGVGTRIYRRLKNRPCFCI